MVYWSVIYLAEETMERLTERKRNNDGSGISTKSLVVEDGMRKGFPSGHCVRIVTKLADYEHLTEVCNDRCRRNQTV